MSTVVVLGWADHQVLFTTQNFFTSDTTTIREAILNMFQNANGLNDINMTGDKFQLFPNPADEFLNIGTIEKGISSLHDDITDITGKNVMSSSNENFGSSSIDQINTPSLNNGRYFVSIHSTGQSHRRKLMVIHCFYDQDLGLTFLSFQEIAFAFFNTYHKLIRRFSIFTIHRTFFSI